MELETLFSYLGALGVGGLLGVVIKSAVDARLQNRKMLFEARTKAYAGITGRVLNLFQEPDIHVLSDPAKFVRIGEILSEPMLLGSQALVELLSQYRTRVNQLHSALSARDQAETARAHEEATKLAGQVYDQMRWDLHGGRKSLFTEQGEDRRLP